jgi:hypothetical protein
MAKLVNIIPDDASYYFKIAENLALGKGMTFDSFHQTNGVHPLWLFIITPFFLLEHIGLSGEVIFRILFFLQTILQVSAGFLIYKAIRSFTNNNVPIIISALFLYLIIIKFTNGLETPLFFFMLSLLIWFIVSITYLWHWFIAGIAAGLCILSRLDSIFIVPALIIAAIADYKTKKYLTPRTVVYFVSGVIIIVSPYLIYNQLVFGSIVPISGILKSSTSYSLLSVSDNFKSLNKLYMLVFPLAVVYLSFYWSKLNRFIESSASQNKYRFVVVLLCLTIIMHAIHTGFFMKWGLFDWHFALYPVTAIFILVEPVNYLIEKLPRLKYLITYSALILILGFICYRSASYKNFPKDWTEVVYNAAVWTRNHTSQDKIFAMKDAGHFAFFSGREVINLDGLVNSFNYQDVLRDKKLNDYLSQNKVSYIVQHAFPGRNDIISGDYEMFSLPYISHKFGVISDPLILLKKDEIYRSGIYNHGGKPMVLLIWKYNHSY